MKLALRYLAFVSLVFMTGALYAQNDTLVRLAVIGEINVTLNDNCEALLIPQEVLTGDFDADGDGVVVPFDAFNVVVEDGNTDNGAIIDRCGTYTFRITADDVPGFTVGWGIVNAEDKTSPEFTAIPEEPAGPLYCNQIEGIDLGLLPNTVARCYRVNTFTGQVIAGTLDPQLRLRLMAGGGLPTATDNCSEEVEICVNDIINRDAVNPQCNDVELTRTFTVRDGSCNSVSGEANAPAVASYTITFTRPGLDDLDVTNIPEVITIECDELEDMGLAFGDLPDPRPQDLPFFDGPNGSTIPLRLGENGGFCNIGITFEDSPPIVTCELAYKVIRTYTVIDWCVPTDVRTLTQIVKIGDFTAPVFTAPVQDLDFDGVADDGPLEFLTNAGNQCGAYIRLDMASIGLSDACSNDLELRADIFPNGNTSAPIGTFTVNLNDNNAEVTTVIPVGSHVLRYTYNDECGNADFTDIDIRVMDGTAPVAVCEDGLNVSITSGQLPGQSASTGLAILTPEMLDAGSYDDCSNVSLAIARVRQNADGSYSLLSGSSYGPSISLTCEDLGSVLVGLRVTDELGNENYCWLSVLVEDKAAPTCSPPGPMELTCIEYEAVGLPATIQEASDDELNAAFGEAFGTDNCDVVVSQSIVGSVNNCGVGSFTRTFTATDGEGFTNVNPCRQRINVEGVHDYIISFPADAEAFCMQTPSIDDVIIVETGCDLITREITIDTFASDADECYKLRINHSLINWCEYNTLGEPYLIPRDYDGDNNLRERTYLHVIPNNPGDRTDDSAVLDGDANRNNGGFLWPVDDGDDTDGTDDNNGADNEDNEAYGTDNSRGAFLYQQFIKIHDEIAPQITENNPVDCFPAQGVNCTGNVSLVFELTDACTAQDQLGVRIELDVDYRVADGFNRTRLLLDNEITSDAEGNYTISLSNVPVGAHAVRIQGTDGCGNVDNEIVEFCVTDALAPTPICIGQLTVTLMPDGEGGGTAAMWATDFIASDVEDCSGEVTYSIYTEFEAGAAGFNPVPGRDGIILNCNSDETVPVRVYAFDPAGRGDYCSVFTLVQRSDNACDQSRLGNIAGTVISEGGNAIGGVSMQLSGIDLEQGTLSDDNGGFLFENLRAGDDYTIDADLDIYINHSQGVSTFDLVLITRHILGLQPIPSAYRRLAADANADEEISVQDIIAIRRLILGLDDSYRNNTAYRFIDAKFIFPVVDNPWATNFPEVVNENNLDGNVFDADFIGVMVGDVNGNGTDNFGQSGRPRSEAVNFLTEDVNLIAGETKVVTIKAGDVAGLTGWQGTFRFDESVAVNLLDGGALSAANLNTRLLERGWLAFSYHAGSELTAVSDLLTVELTASENTSLSEVLSVSDDLVFSEAYTNNGRASLLNIAFMPSAAAQVSEPHLSGASPNPLVSATTIRFELPEAAAANITVRDITGRIVLEQKIDAVGGANQLILNREQFRSAGMYLYTLTSGDYKASRKLLVR